MHPLVYKCMFQPRPMCLVVFPDFAQVTFPNFAEVVFQILLILLNLFSPVFGPYGPYGVMCSHLQQLTYCHGFSPYGLCSG